MTATTQIRTVLENQMFPLLTLAPLAYLATTFLLLWNVLHRQSCRRSVATMIIAAVLDLDVVRLFLTETSHKQ